MKDLSLFGTLYYDNSLFVGFHPRAGSVCLKTIKRRLFTHLRRWKDEMVIKSFKGPNAWCYQLGLLGHLKYYEVLGDE